MVTCRLPATSGSKPMMTNSVVPMPKDAAASARIGREIMQDPFTGRRCCAAIQKSQDFQKLLGTERGCCNAPLKRPRGHPYTIHTDVIRMEKMPNVHELRPKPP